MSRNWGIPSKPGNKTLRSAKNTRPIATLIISFGFGIVGAIVAGLGFTQASDLLAGLFHDKSLYGAVFAAAFGCWFYIWLVRPRFAAHFNPAATEDKSEPFFDITRFYARAAAGLLIFLFLARFSQHFAGDMVATLLLCAAGGGGAAAAFQTVIAFVPGYDQEPGA